MDLDVIFWLVIGGFYILRLITGKKGKKPTQPRSTHHPETQPQLSRQPQPDISHITEGTGVQDERGRLAIERMPASAGETRTPVSGTAPPAEVEIGQVLGELRKAFGLGQTPASAPPPTPSPRRDAEVFGGSEERFEKELPFHELKSMKEDRFEKRPAYFVPEQDREDAFERKNFRDRGSEFSDDAFEKKSTWSGVEFKQSWKGHKSDFEYHSPLEKHAKKDSKSAREVSPQEAQDITQRSPADYSSFTQLDHVSDLQKAVLLHEILGPPISQRTQSGRRRPS